MNMFKDPEYKTMLPMLKRQTKSLNESVTQVEAAAQEWVKTQQEEKTPSSGRPDVNQNRRTILSNRLHRLESTFNRTQSAVDELIRYASQYSEIGPVSGIYKVELQLELAKLEAARQAMQIALKDARHLGI